MPTGCGRVTPRGFPPIPTRYRLKHDSVPGPLLVCCGKLGIRELARPYKQWQNKPCIEKREIVRPLCCSEGGEHLSQPMGAPAHLCRPPQLTCRYPVDQAVFHSHLISSKNLEFKKPEFKKPAQKPEFKKPAQL